MTDIGSDDSIQCELFTKYTIIICMMKYSKISQTDIRRQGAADQCRPYICLKGKKGYKHMKGLNEELLEAWLRLSKTICNERIVSDMPYNESVICNILYRNKIQNPGTYLTATDLCKETGMLKSQMNRTLTTMENKGVIIRERSKTDKRQVYVKMNPEQSELYQRQHQKILELIDKLVEKAGKEKAEEILEKLHVIADIAEEVIE